MTKGQKVNYIKVSYTALTAILIVVITMINVNFNQQVLALQNITPENQTGHPNVTGGFYAAGNMTSGNTTGGGIPPLPPQQQQIPTGLTAQVIAGILENRTSVPDNQTMSTP